ncbi:hypothetical protein SAMN05444483_107110 [Salegentibacter echinorum]|uniref:Glycoside hydrolase 123-like N-terminal domain-containing protein n=1 Tax=Salegentibacter echinorum TaxID=1073325 RepID=A0A1M5IE24_SALEC|nr:glycoside hydrolase domain-containing protein [Salegentibacter echinorum]SHG26515.1 hypothetical protein SAMN05444483_107110 [Salegentibacter echinorum]
MKPKFNKKLYCHLFLIMGCILFANDIQAQEHNYPPEPSRWEADSLGNQRAVIKVENPIEEVITITIPWRNRNVKSEQLVYVVDSTRNTIVTETKQFKMTPEYGVISFNTKGKKGIYYVYYLPYKLTGSSNYPDAVYKTTKLSSPSSDTENTEGASVIRFDAVDSFNSNDPMEIIATKDEEEKLKNENPNRNYLVFPERRNIPIKMKQYLPKKWIESDIKSTFKDETRPGENYTFQLGVWAFRNKLNDVRITFSDLKDKNGKNMISAKEFHSFNLKGIDYTGKPFRKTVGVKKGLVKAFWCGVKIPESIAAGSYSGKATITTNNQKPTTISIQLDITDDIAKNKGIDKPWKQTRLEWLNSTLAQENSVIEPYTPLKVSNNTISLLGRNLILNENGLPNQIQTFFTEEMTDISSEANNILEQPFHFQLIKKNEGEIQFKSSGISYQTQSPGLVSWISKNISQKVNMTVSGNLEFDGHVNYEVKVVAKENVQLRDIALQIPMQNSAAEYILGLGHKGGNRPQNINWKWDVANKNQDGMWLGNVNKGVQLSLRDERYQRPLNTNFYLQKPLLLPTSWGNNNKGGIKIFDENSTTKVQAYSGAREMKKGDTLFYNFTLLITPFHTLQTNKQWENRYYHAYSPVEEVVESGSNVINIHHANEINPYINYPFIATEEMKSYIDAAHEKGLKVKIYNTIREISNRMYELYPIKNLDNEIFSSGEGKGYSWLQEHLDGDYIAAWFVSRYKDAAIINSGMNRWHNYYVEGMNWLVQNIGIDGIYLDDVAFDRVTMKRVKRVLTQNGHPGMIDLHSANQFNERDGFNNSANLYMDHFPYLNRLWFGEYFDYEKGSPEFYLTEVSGIPFGLMGEMLQDGGNQWRGMLYGMTNRMPYQEKKPDAIWKVWDDFGIKGSKMIGYWVKDNPVKTNNKEVLATIYKKDNKVLVSLASWASSDTNIKLNIDWKKLNLNVKDAKIEAPEIRDFQSHQTFQPGDQISIKKNKGILLTIE